MDIKKITVPITNIHVTKQDTNVKYALNCAHIIHWPAYIYITHGIALKKKGINVLVDLDPAKDLLKYTRNVWKVLIGNGSNIPVHNILQNLRRNLELSN